jgi:hypothetical protein
MGRGIASQLGGSVPATSVSGLVSGMPVRAAWCGPADAHAHPCRRVARGEAGLGGVVDVLSEPSRSYVAVPRGCVWLRHFMRPWLIAHDVILVIRPCLGPRRGRVEAASMPRRSGCLTSSRGRRRGAPAPHVLVPHATRVRRGGGGRPARCAWRRTEDRMPRRVSVGGVASSASISSRRCELVAFRSRRRRTGTSPVGNVLRARTSRKRNAEVGCSHRLRELTA